MELLTLNDELGTMNEASGIVTVLARGFQFVAHFGVTIDVQ